MKLVAVTSLVLVQVILGYALGTQSLESGSAFGQIIGTPMVGLAVYRIILFRIGLIDDSYFEDTRIATSGLLSMIGIGVVLIALTALVAVPDLMSLSFAYIIADVCTGVRMH